MQTKDQKAKFVENGKALLKSYKLIGIVPLARIPDRLLQTAKNKNRDEIKLIIGRKTLLTMILESDERGKQLIERLEGTSAILLSNANPFDIYKKFKESTIKLAAKPGQLAPSDIIVDEGETSLQPGQAVTELKTAGIDVRIDKGKVLISKTKTLVAQGSAISLNVAKALHTLGVMPFVARIEPSVINYDKIMYTKEILDIDPNRTISDLVKHFGTAIELGMRARIITRYTLPGMIGTAYRNAIALGIGINAYDKGIIEILIGKAAAQANALGSLPTDHA